LGKFVCYDLNKVFARKMTKNEEVYEASLTIPADSFLHTPDYISYSKFHPYRFPFNPRTDMQPDSLMKWNPQSYHAYMLAGDYYLHHEQYKEAIDAYQRGLTKEIATVQEKEHMERNLKTAEEKQK